MATIDLRLGDCLEVMKTMPYNSVDVVLTSPPYNTARAVKTDRGLQNMENRYISYEDQKTDEEYIRWTIDIFSGLDKVIKPNGVILYNISYSSENTTLLWYLLPRLMDNTNFMVADCIIWKKGNSLPNNVSHNKLTRITEYVFVFCRKTEFRTFKTNKKVTSESVTGQKYYENIFNFIEARNNDGAVKNHKATYSSDLCKKLLSIYATENAVVFDPFLGTGTTAIACKELNLNFIGSEITKEYFEYSERRINNATELEF